MVSKITDEACRQYQVAITNFDETFSGHHSYQGLLGVWPLDDEEVWDEAPKISALNIGNIHIDKLKFNARLLAEIYSYMPAYCTTLRLKDGMTRDRPGHEQRRPVIWQPSPVHPFCQSLGTITNELKEMYKTYVSPDRSSMDETENLLHDLDLFTQELLQAKPGQESIFLVAMMRMHCDIYDILSASSASPETELEDKLLELDLSLDSPKSMKSVSESLTSEPNIDSKLLKDLKCQR